MRKRESIVGTCEGKRRENKMFYNLIMHREFTMFSNVFQYIRNHCKYPLILVKFETFDIGVFFRFFLNIKKGMSYRKLLLVL
jgi:hypothetical protein